MARPKEYSTNAERQAAYRERHRDRRPPREDTLALLARSLHIVLQTAVEDQQSILPTQLLGERADATLRNLIGYIRWNTLRGKADPLLQPLASFLDADTAASCGDTAAS